MTLPEVGIVVAIASSVGGAAVGIFRWMLRGHEAVCSERWMSLKESQHETAKKNDERHADNQKDIGEVKQSQVRTETQLSAIATTLAVLAERTKGV